MKRRWATESDVGSDVLEPLQRSLTVDAIMTPRARLATCRRDETARAITARNKKAFSYLPVIDRTERFLGLYRAERWFGKEAPDEPIGDDFEPFSEDHVIGTDASIIEFVMTADERPTRLVVSGDRVAGLVSLSDLQRLPVRAAIFALITSLEIAMAKRIEVEWPNDARGWLDLLSTGRQAKLLSEMEAAKGQDGFISEIVFTQISDKATIIKKKKLVPGSGKQLKRDFKAIRDLRDDVVHANYYAETPEDARRACEIVRKIRRIQEDLSEGLREEDLPEEVRTPART